MQTNSGFLHQAGFFLLFLVAGIFLLLLAVYLLRHFIWHLRYPFLILNWVQWTAYNPLRDFWKHPHTKFGHLAFYLLFGLGIGPLWWLLIHLALTPLRFINALYFNMLLFLSVNVCDSVAELFHPKREIYRTQDGFRYLYLWFSRFPKRLWAVFHRNFHALLESILMTGVDTVLPTYTMYHGTSFKGIATNIAQEGRWLVGGGDYAGSGIYFGFYKRTAEHYAKDEDHAIIVARVTLFPCRNSATFSPGMKRKIGNDGLGITAGLGFPWKSIEHWRDHTYAQWFEYCLIQPGKAGQYVRNWRARPIAVIKNNAPSRIWGGLSLWTCGAGGTVAIVFSWGVICLGSYLLHVFYHI